MFDKMLDTNLCKKDNNMIENIDIKKYKYFENFKLENLSRINIISGKNNVGKTALLECLYLENGSGELNIIAKNRDIEKEYFEKYIKNIKFSFISNNLKLSYEVKNKNSLTTQEKRETSCKTHQIGYMSYSALICKNQS